MRRLLTTALLFAPIAAFVALSTAFAALMYAFVTSDFSVANVAANSHTDKPMLYKVAGTWGSHEGSMLLWCLALTGCGAAVAGLGRGLPAGLKALTVAVRATSHNMAISPTIELGPASATFIGPAAESTRISAVPERIR